MNTSTRQYPATSTDGPAIAGVEQLVTGDSLITVGGPRGVEVLRLSAEQREALISALVGHRQVAEQASRVSVRVAAGAVA